MTESRYWIWLSHIYGIGPRSAQQLIERYESPQALFELAQKPGAAAFEKMKPIWKDKLYKAASEAYIDTILENLQKKGIKAVTRADDDYPPLLAEIYDPPLALYTLGRGTLSPERPIAVIGTRLPSPYGTHCARHFGHELASNGFCVVSGMARGVDTWAHRGALEANGAGSSNGNRSGSGSTSVSNNIDENNSFDVNNIPTIAVLGGGVDIIYPAENERLYYEIIKRGLVISESVPGTQPAPGLFPARNRIISGLSLGVLVIEAAVKSGTNITVNEALEQGREVMAVPGRITDPASEGTNLMLKSHATLVTTLCDITDALGLELAPQFEIADVSGLSEAEEIIYNQLKNGQKTTDELADLTGVPISKLNSALTALEIRGIIKQLPGRLFTLPIK